MAPTGVFDPLEVAAVGVGVGSPTLFVVAAAEVGLAALLVEEWRMTVAVGVPK